MGGGLIIPHDKEKVINYLNNLYSKIESREERTKLWRYDEKRIEIDNFLDCMDRVISYIEREGLNDSKGFN